IWFFLLNLPFYILGLIQMGLRFTIKSFIAVAMVSAMTELFPQLLSIESVNIYFAALLSGALIGMGLIAVFRHGGSLGGVGVLALFLQERMGVQAGWVQLGFDAVLFAAAFAVLDWQVAALSLLGALVVNVIVGVNHRRDRYIGR
ncbi:MAG: YitT family protein, partial [Pseudomonadota bacterium]